MKFSDISVCLLSCFYFHIEFMEKAWVTLPTALPLVPDLLKLDKFIGALKGRRNFKAEKEIVFIFFMQSLLLRHRLWCPWYFLHGNLDWHGNAFSFSPLQGRANFQTLVSHGEYFFSKWTIVVNLKKWGCHENRLQEDSTVHYKTYVGRALPKHIIINWT